MSSSHLKPLVCLSQAADDDVPHGAWFDETRIATVLVDNGSVWRDLAQKSIQRYDELQKQSGDHHLGKQWPPLPLLPPGVCFYSPVGYLTVVDPAETSHTSWCHDPAHQPDVDNLVHAADVTKEGGPHS